MTMRGVENNPHPYNLKPLGEFGLLPFMVHMNGLQYGLQERLGPPRLQLPEVLNERVNLGG